MQFQSETEPKPKQKKHTRSSTSAASASPASASRISNAQKSEVSRDAKRPKPSNSPTIVHELDGTNDLQIINSFKLKEREHTIVYTFGRFQPPTIGHGELIKKMWEIATQLNVPYQVFVSKTKNIDIKDQLDSKEYHSTTANKNPLDIKDKISYMYQMFPEHQKNIISVAGYPFHPDQTVTPFTVFYHLLSQGYKNLIYVLGSDRSEDPGLTNGLKKQAKQHEVNLIFVSAGKKRNDASTDIAGMSGTKLRTLAVKKNIPEFFKGVDSGGMNIETAIEMMNKIRSGLGYTESRVEMPTSTQGGVYLQTIMHIKEKKSGRRKNGKQNNRITRRM